MNRFESIDVEESEAFERLPEYRDLLERIVENDEPMAPDARALLAIIDAKERGEL